LVGRIKSRLMLRRTAREFKLVLLTKSYFGGWLLKQFVRFVAIQ